MKGSPRKEESRTTASATTPSKNVGGGIFEDFDFRFGKTYTANDDATLNSPAHAKEMKKRNEEAYQYVMSHIVPNSFLEFNGAVSPQAKLSSPLAAASPQPPLVYTKDFATAVRTKPSKLLKGTAAGLLGQPRTHTMCAAPLYGGPEASTDPAAAATAPGAARSAIPNTRTLEPPVFGLAAGVEAIGSSSEAFAVTAEEKNAMLAAERRDNELLFQWWESRQTERLQHRRLARVEGSLSEPLGDDLRALITKEEDYWLATLRAGNGPQEAVASVNPTTTALGSSSSAAAAASRGKNNGALAEAAALQRLTGKGTARGVTVPVASLEALFRAVRTLLHRQAAVVLENYQATRAIAGDTVGNEDSEEAERFAWVGDGSPRAARATEEDYVKRCIASETALADETVTNARLVPSTVSLPPERVLMPVLRLEAATAVALLWKILDEAGRAVQGMDFAVQLYKLYVLPHVYDRFALFHASLPDVGGLSEQVALLATLPLRAEEHEKALVTARQSRADVEFLEHAVKHFALRSWRRVVAGVRRRDRLARVTTDAVRRLKDRTIVRAAFDAWRLETRENAHQRYLEGIRREYQSFLQGSEIASEISKFPLGAQMPEMRANRSRLIGVRLAETAAHQKPPPLPAPPSKGKLGDSLPPSVRQSLIRSVSAVGGGGGTPAPASAPQLALPSLSIRGSVNSTPVLPLALSATTGGTAAGATGATGLLSTSTLPAYGARSGPQPGGFEEMIEKLKEMESVCNSLRGEIAVQNKMLRKLEHEATGLQQRNEELEQKMLVTLEEKMHYCNLVQEKQFAINERDRRIVQLKARIRAHRNRPWQRTLMRIAGELCRVSTQGAEAADEKRVRRDMQGDADDDSTNNEQGGEPGQQQEAGGITAEQRAVNEDERLFGQLAPIVLSTTSNMPSALTILQDWANACLDDLQSLDDLKGGALSMRFTTFSEEARNGVLLSRVLFYLALPRYLERNATSLEDQRGKESARSQTANSAGGDPELVGSGDYAERRQQLLERRNVQLDSPFPVYSDCFGDILSMRFHERMLLLLNFATDLVANQHDYWSDTMERKRRSLFETVMGATHYTPAPPTARVELQEVIDPHAMACGERSAIVTFVALLYVRFAHPFNHKCKQSAALEKAAIYCLLGGRDGMRLAMTAAGKQGDAAASGSEVASLTRQQSSIEEAILEMLDDEDKSPWQLFKERCVPVFGSAAHPFLLRGNFWPSDAFDSPELAQMLGELGAALNRSLDLHRWHVTLACLAPAMTYTGVSRAIFTGPRASPLGLQVGAGQQGDWTVPLASATMNRIFSARAHAMIKAVEQGLVREEEVMAASPCPPRPLAFGSHDPRESLQSLSFSVDPTAMTPAAVMSRDRASLLRAIAAVGNDLASVFLRRAVLSAESALPALDLGGWRLLFQDMQLISLDPEDEYVEFPFELNELTEAFYKGVAAEREASSFTAGVAGNADSFRPFSPSNFELPVIAAEMTFPAFLMAFTILADGKLGVTDAPADLPGRPRAEGATAPEGGGSPRSSPRERPAFLWTGDALAALVYKYVVASPVSILREEPQTVIKRITAGTKTAAVLNQQSTTLLFIFNHYSRDVFGASALEKEDLLKLLRDAMLTSTEISQYLIFELFHHCCIRRVATEEEVAARRRDMDGKARDLRRAAGRAVSIVDPKKNAGNSSSTSPATTTRKRELTSLDYTGFTQFLCILCHFKQPNPLIPFDQRLGVFLRRSLIRPLAVKIEGLTALINFNGTLPESMKDQAEGNEAH